MTDERFLYVLVVGVSYQVSLGWSHWDHKRCNCTINTAKYAK